MSERDYAPLSIACVRGLCDKLYEKRKFAGGEIEKMVKDFADANNTSQIKRLIRVLGQDLMSSTNPNVKNGALMGLSSVAVGLGKGCEPYTGELLSPIIACLSESESRVRYQAVEALFNVAKIARGAALRHFAAVFDALARLAADPEPQVKQAAELLDRLLKDIVTESSTLEVSWLVGLVRERMYARGAAARQFAVAWLAALDAVPSVRLQRHLPDLLDPLFKMLDDPNPEIRRMCEVQLGEFLRSIRAAPAEADLPAMINILITHAQSTEELVQLTAVTWMWWFLSLAGGSLRRHASGVLSAVLPALAYHDDARSNIRETASNVNQLLLKLVVEGEEAPGERESETEAAAGGEGERDGESAGRGEGEGDGGGEPALGALVGVLTQMLHHNSVHTKVAALEWILRLYGARAAGMAAHTERVWGAVALSVADPSDDVVRRALAVLAEICSAAAPPGALLEASPYYHKFLRALLRLLANDEALLDDRGAFIVRQLCVLLNAEQVYAALARLLADEADLRFAATMVDTLSTILLTAAELHDLRATLRDTTSPAGAALFAALSGCWCHSAVALLALCLLTHNYTHCNRLIATLVIFLIKAISGDLEITVDFLTEVDKLVQLIESPIFAYLRLELLDGSAKSLALRGALYGLLMLLPQSDAFHLLRRRLQCAPPPPPQPLTLPSSQEEPALEALVAEFARVQAAHRRYRMLDRSRHPRHS